MKILAQRILNAFKDKIIDPQYHPTTPVEILKARLTATMLLQHEEADIVKLAEAFIKRTSTYKQDFDHLQRLATWTQLHLCSSYTNTAGTFIEYKLEFTDLDNRTILRHFHAQYEIKGDACFFVSQTPQLIRVIADPILHRPGILFPQEPTAAQRQELEKQIEHAKSVLIQTSGAGIAANQCALIDYPYRFTIVGVFYDIPAHVNGVNKRYPNTKFPPARIMINPVITSMSSEVQQFNHACLSVPCANRCAVKSPMEMSVSYQDPTQNMALIHVTMKGIDAVVLWHELMHILNGKTYMDVTFESLARDELIQFKSMLTHELQKRGQKDHVLLPELSVPPFHFSVKMNESDMAKLDPEELKLVLPKMTEETLKGLHFQAGQVLRRNATSKNESLQSSSVGKFSIYSASMPAGDHEKSSTPVSKL